MRALTLRAGRGAAIEDVPEPPLSSRDLLVESVVVGVCGTDRWLLGRRPSLPPGQDYLVMGHESLGRVVSAPAGSEFAAGELVVGTVRRPDPVPCASCRRGEVDFCENGRYTERGITGRDGFASERYALEADYAIRVDPGLGLSAVLVEPVSIVVKAWAQLDRVVRRPIRRALILGAGPIGLLATLVAAQRGYAVEVVDRVGSGPKVDQVAALGAEYHRSPGGLTADFDVVLECTGSLTSAAIRLARPGGATCLIGGGHGDPPDPGTIEDLAGHLLTHNKIVVGTVNSNPSHFLQALTVLASADPGWLHAMIGPRVDVEQWRSAIHPDGRSIKAVIRFADV